MGAYAASKAGVQKLTEALSEEVKDRGITVNAILPGIIDTPRNRLDMPTADFLEVGPARGDCRGHRVPGVERGPLDHRRGDPGIRARLERSARVSCRRAAQAVLRG